MGDEIDVGALRGAICGFAYRLGEYVNADVERNALGTDGLDYALTDFAEAFRKVLAVARIRLSRDEHGNLVVHDLTIPR